MRPGSPATFTGFAADLVATVQPLCRSIVVVLDPAGALPAEKATADGPEPKRKVSAVCGCPASAASISTCGSIRDPVHPMNAARRAATVVGCAPPR